MGAAGFAAFAGSLINAEATKSAARDANKISMTVLPNTLSTGRSTFNTNTGALEVDKRIRKRQNQSRRGIRSLQVDTLNAFDQNASGIRDLRTDLAGIRGDFEGNQSAFREAQLAPLQEGIARGRGDLDRELGRTNVRGSFANQQRTGFELDSARELRHAEAEIENQRINKLGDFLQMDADFLKDALASDTGRVSMLAELENIIIGMNTEQFDQE